MKKVANLSWPDRLALVRQYNPSQAAAAKALGVSIDELKTAQEMESAGNIVASPDFDSTPYVELFTDGAIQNPNPKTGLQSVVRVSGRGQPPMTATRRVSEPKKRGRKGDQISKAFSAIPTVATDVEAFAKTHGVSIAVLRQSKRFDRTGGLPVRVKKDKATKTLMIWRDSEASE